MRERQPEQGHHAQVQEQQAQLPSHDAAWKQGVTQAEQELESGGDKPLEGQDD